MKHILILLMGWLLLWCPLIQAQNAHSCRYWFDQDYSSRQQVVIGNEPLLIETSNIIDGLHTLYLQIGEDSSAYLSSYLFMKISSQLSQSDSTPLWWHYSIDGTPYPPISVTYSRQLIHMDLDVSTIADGLHTLSYFIRTESGYTIDVNSSFFYKVPLGINGINRYDYCFNGDWNNAYQIDTMATDSLRIIKLINVDTFPIRSSNFFFDPNDGTPVIHARNEISFRFWDTEYRFAEKSSQYIDYNVTDTIFADTLERDTTKVIPSPTNNAIHWFKMAVGTGDSLSFLTDRRCSMQLYAPSGEMVYHSSGDSVLSWTGCHAWEDGVYYLAVHDAEGTGSISVSYQWIYRYAVLAWDVHRVGNGGISTITFKGNGFDSITNIILYNNTFDSIIPVAFYGKNAECCVTIDFTNVQLGSYSSTFNFGEYWIVLNDILQVESSVGITIGLSVNYSNNFLRGTSAVYNVSITNYGNSTMYDVPVEIMIRNDTTINNIRRIRIVDEKNDEWGYCGTGIINDTLDENVKNIIQDILENRTGLNMFLSVQDSLSHYENLYTMSLLTIPPYGQYKFRIEILSTDTVSCYVSIPYEWPFLIPVLTDDDTSYQNSQILMNSFNLKDPSNNHSKSQSSMCCEKEKYECLTHTIADVASYFPGVGCAASTIDFFSFYAIELWCASEGNFYDKWYEFCYQQSHKNTPLRRATVEKGWNAILQCLTLSLDQYYKRLNVLKKRREAHLKLRRNWNPEDERWYYHTLQINALDDEISSLWNAIVELLTNANFLKELIDAHRKPFREINECRQIWHNTTGCNDNQTDGGTQPPVNSLDPNEITGYIAESGSHAVSAEQIMLPFMIEFENDTAFATAHAHTVVVRDTINGNVFDLESFSATAFTIGDEVTSISGGHSFSRTVDMRPTIDALAQVKLDYRIDTSFAVATWTFTSLDPMMLMPTVADTLGFLAIGGTGEVGFTINRKANLPDSTVIDNRAWIVFDNEEPIATSTWRNIIDNTPPVSSIDSITYSGSTATVTINATDNLSGAWRYNVYALMDGDVLLPMAINVPIDSAAVFTRPDEVAQFRPTAIDSAGNVEPLVLTPLITTVYDTLTITACDNYTWGDSLYTISGEYTQSKTATLRNAPDTVTTLILTVNHSTTATESATACDSYTWHGTAYTTSTNTPTYSTTNAQGCDSTVTLSLIINNSSTNVESVTACDSYTWHGSTYTASTITPTYSTTNVQGCDSTVTLSLIINNSSTSVESITACDSYTWHGNAYTASTNTPTYSTTNAQGCDSTVTLHLTVNNSSTGIDVVNACNSFTWHGTTYTVSTNTPTYTSLNAAGCDSVTTLHLTINQSLSSIDAITACDRYTWHGTTYTSSTFTPTYSTTSTQGCDSTVTLHLTIKNSTTAIETATACDSYTWHGTAYTVSTYTPTYSTTNAYGCDSTITLHLTINNSTTAIENATACDSYTWHGTAYTASTNTPTYSTTNAYGCDSTVTLHLTINYSTTAIETATACDSYTWHGTAYTVSTYTPTYSTTNAYGCDSTITLHLTINNSTTAIENATACDSYTWHGTVYTASTNTPTYSTTNAYGCDSTVTLHLTINYSTTAIETATACDSYTWHDSVYTASTLNSQFSTLNSQGCDSTITLHLTINHSTSAIETATACDSYTWHDSVYTASTSDAHFSTLNSVGCDSTVTLHLTINYSTHDTIVDSAVGSYTWHGNTYTESGEYLFESLTEDGCDSVIVLQLTINEVGISTVDSLGHITLYPNPTTGWVTIVHDGVSSVEVFDQSGCCIATFHGTSLFNIKDLPTGVYTLRITYQGGSAVKRIIKH